MLLFFLYYNYIIKLVFLLAKLGEGKNKGGHVMSIFYRKDLVTDQKLEKRLETEADLVDGKVPLSQLPTLEPLSHDVNVIEYTSGNINIPDLKDDTIIFFQLNSSDQGYRFTFSIIGKQLSEPSNQFSFITWEDNDSIAILGFAFTNNPTTKELNTFYIPAGFTLKIFYK